MTRLTYLSKSTICPHCHSQLIEENNKLICSQCNKIYPIKCDIPDFRDKDNYWCNVDREKMQHLNRRARETGDWLNSAKEIIPEYSEHFTHFYRADCQFLWPANKDSIILDAGSMWGGLTIPAAQFHRDIYAIDKTIETLEFLKIRAEQMGLKNIHTLAAPVKSLPFADNLFDLVILNGVLEWVGLEEDTILEQHWKGKRTEEQAYFQTPEEMQIDVLKEMRRVLKPNGYLYIAMENRYGIQYFLTYPDDHNNIRFVTFLPRYFANKISKIMKKGEYRTYIYSPVQLVDLLRRSGFNVDLMYGVSPHYIHINKAFPLNLAGHFRDEIRVDGVIPKILHGIVRAFVPKFIAPHIVPSLAFICRKNSGNGLIPRIMKILEEAKVIEENGRYHFVISNNRFENFNSTNVIMYDGNNPLYFCKIARDLKNTGLQIEAENMKLISSKISILKGSNIQIPELIYAGIVDGINISVVTYLNAKNVDLTMHYRMNSRFDRIGITNRFLRRNIGFIEEKLFLRKIDDKIGHAIDSLVEFQKITSKSRLTVLDIVDNLINMYLEKSTENLSDKSIQNFLILKEKAKSIPDIKVSTCSVHGDYDFDNILFFSGGGIGLIDFEHFEENGSPFFDLATLIFNPLIVKWKSSYLRRESFDSYLNNFGAKKYIAKWFRFYCDKKDMPYSLIPLIPFIAVIEQNLKTYPPSRDSNTYPMYGENILNEMFLLKINVK